MLKEKFNINALRENVSSLYGLGNKPFLRGALYFLIMKEIICEQGEKALVDDEDYEYLNQWVWKAVKNRPNAATYVVRYKWDREKQANQCIRMHRVIMKTPKGMQVDHVDHNGLNNQKSNLRNCTQSQNQANRNAYGSSKYLGVSRYNFGSLKGWWVARIRKDGVEKMLGYYRTEEEAALVRDKKAIELFGEFAKLNLPENYRT